MSDPLAAPSPLIPVPQAPPPEIPAAETVRMVEISVDGQKVLVGEGSTILAAARQAGIDTPTLCFLDNLTAANVCRLCVVEVEGSRVLVPACSRKVEGGMVIRTDSERVRLSRKMVLEFLASSVELSTWPAFRDYCERYEADGSRFGTQPHNNAQPVKMDNELYVRDYGKCVLCYKCVQACGVEAQFTFAIGVAGRGASAHISTEFDVPLPESACVYCGNCIGVCPTGALMFRSEFEMRRTGTWNVAQQTKTDTICPYCGVGCDLTVHAQDGKIVKVTSPLDHSVTSGHLCIKGRFGWQFVQIQVPPQIKR
jgi:predicted molibdopterin-dependent oxidoreductase YjgC